MHMHTCVPTCTYANLYICTDCACAHARMHTHAHTCLRKHLEHCRWREGLGEEPGAVHLSAGGSPDRLFLYPDPFLPGQPHILLGCVGGLCCSLSAPSSLGSLHPGGLFLTCTVKLGLSRTRCLRPSTANGAVWEDSPLPGVFLPLPLHPLLS